MKSVKTLTKIKGKHVLMRADFNVPLDGEKVLDDVRIRSALPTISFLRKKGARIVLISHIGRDPQDSLRPVAKILATHMPVKFIPHVLGEDIISAVEEMKDGEVILLENLRSEIGEKEADPVFARALAAYGEIYVNEAFPVSHRDDASIVLVPKLLPAYAGIQLEKEVKELSRALTPKHPFLFIQGGAKAETKLPLIKRFLKEADHVFVGGELANDFFLAQGKSIGESLHDSPTVLLKPFLKNKKLIIPDTVVVKRDTLKYTIPISNVRAHDDIFDVGSASIAALAPLIKKAKLILWNGPMGWYEGGYTEATETLLQLLAEAPGQTIIAGGDTAVLVDRKKMTEKFTFVSTGGGATLEFLVKGTLPGIKALDMKIKKSR